MSAGELLSVINSIHHATGHGRRIEQMKSKRKQQVQAKKKMANKSVRFQVAEVEDTVMVPVPLVDWGWAEFPNVKAVVVKTLENGTY